MPEVWNESRQGKNKGKAKNYGEAENHYNEVLGIDYEYQDARTRLEGLQGGGRGSKGDGE